MSSHFSCIGFPVQNIDAYWALARRAAAEGTRMPAPDGSALARWAVGSGPEIWVQIDRSGEVIGATPFFSAGTPYRVAVTGTGEDPEEPMDGWIDGWLEPTEEDEPFSGVFPLRMSLVDYAVHRSRLIVFPATLRMEIAALVHEADLYPHDAAYTTSPGDSYRLPVQSFVSAAHFGADDPESFQESTALMSGYVADAHLMTNPITDASYWRIGIATQGVTLQACADRDVLRGEPRAGQILAGSFWLLGRLI